MASTGASAAPRCQRVLVPLELLYARVGGHPHLEVAAMSPLHEWSSTMKWGPTLAEPMRMRRGRQYQSHFKIDDPSVVFSLPWTYHLVAGADGMRLIFDVR